MIAFHRWTHPFWYRLRVRHNLSTIWIAIQRRLVLKVSASLLSIKQFFKTISTFIAILTPIIRSQPTVSNHSINWKLKLLWFVWQSVKVRQISDIRIHWRQVVHRICIVCSSQCISSSNTRPLLLPSYLNWRLVLCVPVRNVNEDIELYSLKNSWNNWRPLLIKHITRTSF